MNYDPNKDSDKVNAYIDNLMSQAKGQRDLALQQLDTEHKYALGNNDPQGAQFLESVADQMEQNMGRIPYDYQRYSNKELQDYSNSNTAIAQNKQNAMDTLNADLQQHMASLGNQEGQANQGTVDSLNSRGLMTGQTPTSGLSQTATGYNPLTGLGGVANWTANNANQPFNLENSAAQQNYGIQNTGIQNQFGQQQSALNTQHNYNMNDIKTNARRGAQDENTQYTYGTGMTNNQFAGQQTTLENQRAALQRQNQILNSNLY